MSRNARRIALSLGTAAGAALIAASISMGNAPAARADITDADPLSDLIAAFDPTAFTTSGAPTDPLGLFGYYTDTYLLGPSGLGDPLDPTIDQLVGTITVGPGPATDADPLSDLIAAFDPTAFTTPDVPTDPLGLFAYYTDTYLLGPSGLGDALDPSVDSYVSSLPSAAASVLDVNPVSDLVGAFEPSAFSAGVADLTAPTAVGLLEPVIDGLLNSGSSLF
jgi:hypothetical protein